MHNFTVYHHKKMNIGLIGPSRSGKTRFVYQALNQQPLTNAYNPTIVVEVHPLTLYTYKGEYNTTLYDFGSKYHYDYIDEYYKKTKVALFFPGNNEGENEQIVKRYQSVCPSNKVINVTTTSQPLMSALRYMTNK